MKRLLFVFSLAGILLLAACGADHEYMEAARAKGDFKANFKHEEAQTKGMAEPLANAYLLPQDNIVKEAQMRFGVTNYATTINRVRNQLRQYGAMVVHENEAHQYNLVTNDLIIRVPNANFHALLDSLSNVAESPDFRKVTLRDVSGEMKRMEAVLARKSAEEKRLAEMHKTEKSASKRLKVNAQSRAVDREEEAALNRLTELADKMAFSTLHLHIHQMPAGLAAADELTFGQKMAEAASESFVAIESLLLFLALVWPILLLLILILIGYKRKWLSKFNISVKSKTQTV